MPVERVLPNLEHVEEGRSSWALERQGKSGTPPLWERRRNRTLSEGGISSEVIVADALAIRTDEDEATN